MTAAVTAGFWRRAAAFAVDALWLFCVAGSVAIFLCGQPWPDIGDGSGVTGALASIVDDLLVPLVLVIGWGRFGATPGKALLELRVVRADGGGQVGYIRAFIRYVGYFVSLIPLGFGFIWIAIDPDHRGWHDKLAGTRVVRVPGEDLPAVAPMSPA